MSGTSSPAGVLPPLGVVVAPAVPAAGVVAPDDAVVSGPAVPPSPVVADVSSSSSPPHAVATTPAASARAVRLLNRYIFRFPQVVRWRSCRPAADPWGPLGPDHAMGQRRPRDPASFGRDATSQSGRARRVPF